MDLTPAELRDAIWMAEAELRRITTRIAVKAGYACPEPGCGLTYRHTHERDGDFVWWPPEGEPWPPRRNQPRTIQEPSPSEHTQDGSE